MSVINYQRYRFIARLAILLSRKLAKGCRSHSGTDGCSLRKKTDGIREKLGKSDQQLI